MYNKRKDLYEQALAYLTINGSFLSDLGLFHGKMGITLFFFHYARTTKLIHYEDFAGCLLDEIYEEIQDNLPINLEDGLCGIGWGIEYLIQKGFIEGDTDEILAAIDQKVMEIDPLRLSNLSFRRGLAGIIFYVTARLNAIRKTSVLPFDKAYLKSLEEALKIRKFTKDDEIPNGLEKSFKLSLNGNKIEISIPNCLVNNQLNIDKSFDDNLLGLENGLAGWLWKSDFITQNVAIYQNEKCIFLFDEDNRSIKYGIGTYVNQLIDSLKNTKYKILKVRMFSNINDTYNIQEKGNLINLNIASFKPRGNVELIRKYYRNVFFFIYTFFRLTVKPIFHLNIMQDETLITLLKKYFPLSKIIITVHCTSWGFQLLGNKEQLKEILSDSARVNNDCVIKDFKRERMFMQACDQVVTVSEHSYNDLINLFQIPKEKITLIPHGLQDSYRSLSKKEYIERRIKYGFSKDEQLLIFAGRIDRGKGIDLLVQAFTILINKYSKLRLIIAGDGNFEQMLPLIEPIWSRVTCTGFVKKSILYDLYSISDIGVLPSLHEEFGFVALEMMMMQLPLIVGKTNGLSELVKDNYSGLLIPLQSNSRESSVSLLVSAIEKLLDDSHKRRFFARKGRHFFEEKYTQELFQQKMQLFYENISSIEK